MKMKYVKSTKGTHVYADDREDAAIPTLYIKRSALPINPPAEIEVIITAPEGIEIV